MDCLDGAVPDVTCCQHAGQEAQYQSIIRQAVEEIALTALHPRTAIQVILQVHMSKASMAWAIVSPGGCGNVSRIEATVNNTATVPVSAHAQKAPITSLHETVIRQCACRRLLSAPTFALNVQ